MTPTLFPKTFGGLRLFVQQLVSYAAQADIAYDPFVQDKMLFDRTDEIASITRTYERTVHADVAAGTAIYSTGTIFDYIEAQIKSPQGQWTPIGIHDRAWMNRRDFYKNLPISQRWYNVPPTDPAQIAIKQGGSALMLWPTPSSARVNGFQVHGYALPGTDWDIGADDSLLGTTENSPFPLPAYCFGVVAFSAAVDWIAQAGDSSLGGTRDSDRVAWLIERRQGWLKVAESRGAAPDTEEK